MKAGSRNRVSRPGGHIAVVDFAAHDREELRERHAHARLGFSDEQMLALLCDAGFAPAPSIALPGSPLTVKIWTARKQGGRAPVPLSGNTTTIGLDRKPQEPW